ncbi:amidohydrolase [Fodinibius salinus]|uniref:Amidohydrolase n=1 Tax=Fodinibius salinus TaxID=860790 RepID=A0A5D3YK00_9BACT|nr:amidohydrolase [Fodinibius salinus]TYP92766.1 amidohydrolase [Fodinibius salinus]
MPFNIDSDLTELTSIRHHLHSIAEISGNEQKTSKFITDFLEETAPHHLQTGIGGEGILATYKGDHTGPHILLRSELDALPIPDINDVDYQSKTEGVGHKCGHDGHMTILCGVAQLLAQNPLETGKVSLLFQPAEETGQGASRVVEDEKFQDLSPDYCFALHNLPGFQKHQIIVRKDVFAAASVGCIIRLKGATAHAAHPEEGKSPALAMAQMVEAFSAIPQFYSSLEQAAKVTVINADLGERAFGTSPGEATVMATLRAYDDNVLANLKEQCLRIANHTAKTYELAIDHEWVEEFPSTINNSEAVDYITSAAQNLEHKLNVKQYPFSWSEDFGHITAEISGAMFGLGAGKEQPALHAEDYDFPDEIISTGISMFMQIVTEVLNES